MPCVVVDSKLDVVENALVVVVVGGSEIYGSYLEHSETFFI